jgi:uncharacterized protein (DUF1499 family)
MVSMAACSSERTEDVGLTPKGLSPCPSSANCVSTLAEDASRLIAPLTFTISSRQAQNEIRKVIEAMPRTSIVRDEPGYLHAEFTSKVFRFVDDVEFTIDDDTRRIDFRSASRVGHYDFGTNRKRMEEICRQLVDKEGITRQAT